MDHDLNHLAVRVSAALARSRPEFTMNTRMLGDGDIELFIKAGGDSKSGRAGRTYGARRGYLDSIRPASHVLLR